MHRNFNIGFTSHKNDIHIQLSQWQYWWWFWFAAVWALYFFVILRCYLNKTENYNVTLNTSMRSHGKWGDFLIAIIPLSWCGNILINSNFILRMLEWQNEASLFVIRIQGKQWYWSYKYNSSINSKLQSIYLNVGNNNWLRNQVLANSNFETQNSTLHYIFDYEFKNIHRDKLKSNKLTKSLLKPSSLGFNDVNFNNLDFSVQENLSFIKKLKNVLTYSTFNNFNISPVLNFITLNRTADIWDLYSENIKSVSTYYYSSKVNYNPLLNSFSFSRIKVPNLFETDKLEDTFISEENFRIKNVKFPVKIQNGVLNKLSVKKLYNINNSSNVTNNILFNYKLNVNNTTTKLSHFEEFWGFRQKRYKKLRSFSFSQNIKYSSNSYSSIDNFVTNTALNKCNLYNAFKSNKFKNELIPVTLARRLLRTKRTLVLPVHINLTLITNSYDVVHSWFVPGLGLKIDCVPGRSTHHSLYIDTVGFYYGQCAEICGRYHHHMPIRVCALPYDHFMLWWQTKGLPRMYRSENFTKSKNTLLQKLKY